ncbi:MAG: hypothetical protein H0X69_10495 [Gemmatimonadales bacterium]|nr:hypothetical protein [Gemmatimonadales bacterium]
MFVRNQLTNEGLSKAVDYCDRAIQLDSAYALAYAGKATAIGPLVWYRHLPRAQGLPAMRAAARRALELDGTLGEAHVAQGMIESTSSGIGRRLSGSCLREGLRRSRPRAESHRPRSAASPPEARAWNAEGADPRYPGEPPLGPRMGRREHHRERPVHRQAGLEHTGERVSIGELDVARAGEGRAEGEERPARRHLQGRNMLHGL